MFGQAASNVHSEMVILQHTTEIRSFPLPVLVSLMEVRPGRACDPPVPDIVEPLAALQASDEADGMAARRKFCVPLFIPSLLQGKSTAARRSEWRPIRLLITQRLPRLLIVCCQRGQATSWKVVTPMLPIFIQEDLGGVGPGCGKLWAVGDQQLER